MAVLKIQYFLHLFSPLWLGLMYMHTDNGHPERAFFQKFETFGLGQTNWAEILGGILATSSQTIGTILALWVPCSWESVAGSFFYKKCWFLSLKHITPKYSQNKIWAVKNFGNSAHTSVFRARPYWPFILRPRFLQFVEIWFEKSGSRKVVREKWLTRKRVVL